MPKQAFHTERAGVTGGPYFQTIIHNGLVYLSGQGALDPETGKISTGTIEHETDLAFRNIRAIFEAAGSSLVKIFKVTVYLLDFSEYGRFNELYRAYFTGPLPARTCIQAAGLPFGTRVEIDVIACLD